ncbi:PemK-like, MazF-like toxin of type II toxin-antitoxin system [Isoptericola jiangsuensis]|uniref:PemK-like, MazF-like toxin of type II toxin-antitoxin system n=1 Tax=Isoptericola jiangsuensis TaxID=548579 RepID=A0A2A9EZF8_9MICO|nr:type II toxin-antitoxin system PemK/MazF family toxin [Isoptericola jiangsuensis]PFG43650.1 PemK-like, MazF-like toxin of type II toxin-antitoxin system [Isoptericola jiangsuensis]
MATSSWTDLLRRVVRALRPGRAPARQPGRPSAPPRPGAPVGSYPGDHRGPVTAEYSPALDGDPDPGEVVWTWVPFEEDFSRGKDRPVLLVGRDGRWLLALQLTSKDHDLDAAQEARWGRHWMDIGSGPWDAQGRPSEVRLDRVVRVDAARMRREGAIMPRATFDAVVRGMRQHGH